MGAPSTRKLVEIHNICLLQNKIDPQHKKGEGVFQLCDTQQTEKSEQLKGKSSFICIFSSQFLSFSYTWEDTSMMSVPQNCFWRNISAFLPSDNMAPSFFSTHFYTLLYRKDTEHLYHAFMYSLISLSYCVIFSWYHLCGLENCCIIYRELPFTGSTLCSSI